MATMPYKFKRDCTVCGKPELLSLSDHLRQVHRLKSHERKQWLKAAVFSGTKRSLVITQGVSRFFPQVINTKKETSTQRKRTTAAIKETSETPPHCMVKSGSNCLTMFPLKPKHVQNLCFDIKTRFKSN